MKSYKNIACLDFVDVNVALNSHAYEKKQQSFTLEFLLLFKSFKRETYL